MIERRILQASLEVRRAISEKPETRRLLFEAGLPRAFDAYRTYRHARLLTDHGETLIAFGSAPPGGAVFGVETTKGTVYSVQSRENGADRDFVNASLDAFTQCMECAARVLPTLRPNDSPDALGAIAERIRRKISTIDAQAAVDGYWAWLTSEMASGEFSAAEILNALSRGASADVSDEELGLIAEGVGRFVDGGADVQWLNPGLTGDRYRAAKTYAPFGHVHLERPPGVPRTWQMYDSGRGAMTGGDDGWIDTLSTKVVLWTAEEGESDLVLHLELRRRQRDGRRDVFVGRLRPA